MKPLLFCRGECLVAYTVCSFFLVFFARFSCVCLLSLVFLGLSEKQVREARITFTQGCKSDRDANQMRELLHQDRSAHRHLDLR